MGSTDNVATAEIQSALESIGRSAALIFAATLLSQGLGFLTRVVMARYLPVDGYGNVVIGLSILNLAGIAALVGMPATLSRYLPRKENVKEKNKTVATAFQIVGVFSLALAVGLYLLAEPVARYVFGNTDLIWIIRIFAGVIPFYAVFRLCLGGFRGYETTMPRVVTQNILRPGFQLVGIVLFVSIGLGTDGIAIAYGLGFILVAVIALALFYWTSEFSMGELLSRQSMTKYRKLLAFSVPLAASGATMIIAKQSDLILLGIFLPSDRVGTYEVAFRMAMFSYVLFTPAVGYLFQPIISRFDANDQYEKIDALYTVATRWIVLGSFPAIVLFILFPEQTISLFFGAEYVGGGLALQILVVGFTVALIPGLTANFLTSVGKSKVVFYVSTAAMIINIIGNIVLIPLYGILGAAVATASARSFNNLSALYIIHREYGVHPFDRKFVVPTGLMVLIMGLVVITPLPLERLTFAQGFVVAATFGLTYLILCFATRSIYKVELSMADALFQRFGIPIRVSDRFDIFVR